jgi:hypothetical protein
MRAAGQPDTDALAYVATNSIQTLAADATNFFDRFVDFGRYRIPASYV